MLASGRFSSCRFLAVTPYSRTAGPEIDSMTSASVDLIDGEPGQRRVATDDRLAFGIARDGIEIAEPVRRPRLDDIDHAFGTAASIGEDDLGRRGPALPVVGRQRLSDRNT